MIMAVSLLPAAVAEETEPTETPETAAMTEELGEAAVNNENADDTLIASEDGALAPTGFDVPEDETGRESDLSMKTETSDEPMTFELKDGFTALLDNGVMTVTGEGYLRGYNKAAECPWYEYRNKITEVIFSDGITIVGSHLFWQCQNLVSIQVPDGMTTFYDVFYSCTRLKSVTLPASVTYLCATFPDCTALESFSAPGLETLRRVYLPGHEDQKLYAAEGDDAVQCARVL